METEIVRHVLLGSFKDGASELQIQNFFQIFRQMSSKIDGVISFEYGVNNSSEGMTRGFTHVVMITFINAQARDAYLPHPEHQKFGEWLGQSNIVKELLVIDYIPQK
jgi:hypothetical protein